MTADELSEFRVMAALVRSYGLFRGPHPRLMGAALWLFSWCALRVDDDGSVYGGRTVAFTEVGFCGPVDVWRQLRRLEEHGYCQVRYEDGGFRARILLPRVA